MNVCKNCETTLTGAFCANCGQKWQEGKPTLKTILGEFLQTTFMLDPRMFRTLSELLTRPGTFIKNYLKGKQIRYIGPIHFFALNLALFLIFIVTFGDTLFDFVNHSIFSEKTLESEGEKIQKIQSYVRVNLNYFYFLLPPLLAIFIRLFFKKLSWNYTESLIAATYLVGLAVFLSTVTFLLGIIYHKLFALRILVILFVLPWAMMQFSHSFSIKTYLKSLLTTLLGYSLYVFVVAGLTLFILIN